MSFAAPAFVVMNLSSSSDDSSLAAPPCHDARLLTRGGPLARIVLDGQIYSLRITRAEKLILTK
jgi:hemin uptake protein HemP